MEKLNFGTSWVKQTELYLNNDKFAEENEKAIKELEKLLSLIPDGFKIEYTEEPWLGKSVKVLTIKEDTGIVQYRTGHNAGRHRHMSKSNLTYRKVFKLLEEGTTTEEIANMAGFSLRTLQRRLKEAKDKSYMLDSYL